MQDKQFSQFINQAVNTEHRYMPVMSGKHRQLFGPEFTDTDAKFSYYELSTLNHFIGMRISDYSRSKLTLTPNDVLNLSLVFSYSFYTGSVNQLDFLKYCILFLRNDYTDEDVEEWVDYILANNPAYAGWERFKVKGLLTKTLNKLEKFRIYGEAFFYGLIRDIEEQMIKVVEES